MTKSALFRIADSFTKALGKLNAVELVRVRKRGGIDFEKLEQAGQRLGFTDYDIDWPQAFDDPAFSRKVLCIEQVAPSSLEQPCPGSDSGRGQ